MEANRATLTADARGLAGRIEAMLAGSLARYAAAACGLDPAGHARLELGPALDARGSRVTALWTGTPRSRVTGLGLSGPVSATDLDAVEAFYRPLGRSWCVDCSPVADPSLLELAARAGCGLAVAQAAPGIGSERNFTRAGFSLAFTREQMTRPRAEEHAAHRVGRASRCRRAGLGLARMVTALGQFLFAGGLIVLGGVGLSRSAEVISRRYGLGHLLGGALLIATATSLPDLVMGISAARNGFVDLVVGDLVGAALFNMLVLAVMDLLHYARGRMLSQAAAAHALSGTMSMSLLAIAGIAVALPAEMNPTVAGIGAGVWGIAIAYVLGIRVVFFDQRYVARKQAEAGVTPAAGVGWKPGWAVAVYVASAAVIMFAGPRLAHAAGDLAATSGLGRTFVGTALLPMVTTLPELVAAITAMRIRAIDLVVGNAFGSIAFNLLLLAPVDVAYPGSLLADASPTHAVTCLAAIVTVAVAIMGQLYHAERRTRILEPDAVAVMGLVAGAMVLIYFLR